MATKKPAEEVDVAAAAEEIFKDDKIDTAWTEGGLVTRIARIIASLPDVKPAGENKFFGYRFISDKQVMGLLRPRLSRSKIIIVSQNVDEMGMVPLTTAKGGSSLMTKLHVVWRVMDGIDGESFTGESVGYGDDSGDKGANKAYTAAYKNFLIKLFEIGGDTDIEEDEETDKRAAARESGSSAPKVAQVVIAASEPEGDVARGGRQSSSTEAQIALASRYSKDLSLTPASMGALIARITERPSKDFLDATWPVIKGELEKMDGETLGKLIAKLDDLTKATSDGGAE